MYMIYMIDMISMIYMICMIYMIDKNKKYQKERALLARTMRISLTRLKIGPWIDQKASLRSDHERRESRLGRSPVRPAYKKEKKG